MGVTKRKIVTELGSAMLTLQEATSAHMEWSGPGEITVAILQLTAMRSERLHRCQNYASG